MSYKINHLFYSIRNAITVLCLSLVLMSCSGNTEENDPGPDDERSSFTLNLNVNGEGVITSTPVGIDCGSDCTEAFEQNTSVQLNAVATDGYAFSGWGGACSGADDCTIVMSENREVSALFTTIVPPSNADLIVTLAGEGTVTSTPSGIDCGMDCTETFELNTLVQLDAVASEGYNFSGWGGACSGLTNCSLDMSNDKTVIATFAAVSSELSITDMGLHTIALGEKFTFQPAISGTPNLCRKDLGHDDVQVDSETGFIQWDTSSLNFGRGFYIRIKCSNAVESVYASMIVHLDNTGTSQLRIAGEQGVSQYIGVAGQAMNSGDTIVFPDGEYPVSVSANESYENAFKRTAPTDGNAQQFSTIIARSPGGVTITGAAQGGIQKQKNAFQFSETNYVAVVGFVIKDVQRESLTTIGAGNYLLIDFIGAAGAGTWGLPCSNFSEASMGGCSNAGMRVNGGNPLFQHSYDWGHNRYGIMTRSTAGSITRRSFVRLDEHKGDQPYGGFSNYCDTEHLSQDNTIFDSLAIAAPHYKNYAGLETYPATGCENVEATLKTEGLLSVNNKLSLSLMDQKAGPTHVWESIVSYDSEGTCTPQTNRCGSWLLQADKATQVINSFFGKARGFEGSTSAGSAFIPTISIENSVISDIPGMDDVGQTPRYLPESLLYFRGRSDTFYGEEGYDQITNVRRWPIGGEDIIARNMRSYYNPDALRVGGGTVLINGDRGATASNESISEYLWGYKDDLIPPLVVRVKNKGSYNRVAWEHLNGTRKALVTGWKVICVSPESSTLAELPVTQLSYNDEVKTCIEYGIKALYAGGESDIAYTEKAVNGITEDVLISQYVEQSAPFQVMEVGNNGSGITWHNEIQQYLIVRNNAAIIYRYDVDFNYLGQIELRGNIQSDTEGVAYLEGNNVVVVNELNYAHKTFIDETTTIINGNYDVTPAYRLLPPPSGENQGNKGLEGVAVRPASTGSPARVYACKEGTGAFENVIMKFVYFDLPSPDPTTLLSYDSDLTIIEPFIAETAFSGVITDCAGMVYDKRTGNIIIVSQESRKAIQIDPNDGRVISELNLSGAPQYEGVTIGPNGELVFASEPNWVHIFQKTSN